MPGDGAPWIQADRSICIGSGLCAMYATDTFTQDDAEAKVVIVSQHINDLDAVLRAVESCPTQALAVVDS